MAVHISASSSSSSSSSSAQDLSATAFVSSSAPAAQLVAREAIQRASASAHSNTASPYPNAPQGALWYQLPQGASEEAMFWYQLRDATRNMPFTSPTSSPTTFAFRQARRPQPTNNPSLEALKLALCDPNQTQQDYLRTLAAAKNQAQQLSGDRDLSQFSVTVNCEEVAAELFCGLQAATPVIELVLEHLNPDLIAPLMASLRGFGLKTSLAKRLMKRLFEIAPPRYPLPFTIHTDEEWSALRSLHYADRLQSSLMPLDTYLPEELDGWQSYTQLSHACHLAQVLDTNSGNLLGPPAQWTEGRVLTLAEHSRREGFLATQSSLLSLKPAYALSSIFFSGERLDELLITSTELLWLPKSLLNSASAITFVGDLPKQRQTELFAGTNWVGGDDNSWTQTLQLQANEAGANEAETSEFEGIEIETSGFENNEAETSESELSEARPNQSPSL